MKKVRILVIDDDSITLDLLRSIFEGAAFDVLTAENADDGIKLARSEGPSLIVLDMSLPGMTGIEVLPVLKSHPTTKSIPVVAFSAHDKAESRDLAYEAGCSRYLTKPLDPDRLLSTVMELVS